MLRRGGCCWLKLGQFQTYANNTQRLATWLPNAGKHVAPNNVAICCVGMLRSFGRGGIKRSVENDIVKAVLLKVAEHSFRARSCWCDSARAQGLQKTNMPLIQWSFYLLNARSLFAIFLRYWKQCVDALVLYNKGMLEKVTTQRTQQFSNFPNRKNPVKCNACAVARKIETDYFDTNLLISNDPVVRISRNLAK